MKKNNILVILIILIVIFIGFLSYYKFSNKKEESNINVEESKLINLELINVKKDLKYDLILDEEKYRDNIITKVELTEDYNFFHDEKSINGSVYIDQDGLLHIKNEVDKDDKIISNVKFKTLYSPRTEDYDGIYIYLISNTNNLYYMALKENNLTNVVVEKIETKYPVLNFTDISYNNDISPSGNTLFVLEQDGNIYEVASGLRYHENIKLIFDNIMVYEDNTISNVYGEMLEDENGNYFKIKYIFNSNGEDAYLEHYAIIIITEDDRLISIPHNDYSHYAYLDSYKVKSVKFDQKYPFQLGKLEIQLEDNAVFEFKAKCSIWYCPNELDLK